MANLSPRPTFAFLTACIPTASGSIKAPCSKDTFFGNGTTVLSGTTINSPNDPVHSCVPNTFLISQILYSPDRQRLQVPHP